MLKIISAVGTIGTLLVALLVMLGLDVNPMFQFVGVLIAFITFFPIAIKWNWYCVKTHSLFGFSGIKEFIDIFKTAFTKRNKNRKQFVFIFTWLIYFVLFLASFQFFVINAVKQKMNVSICEIIGEIEE